MTAADITFVIPVRDRAELLREALISLRTQTVTGFATIVVDDGSTEDVRAVVREFAADGVAYVVNDRTPGVSGARNAGNAAVATEWIALADSDDINVPRRVELSLAALAAEPETEALYGNLYTFGTYEGGFTMKQWPHNRPYDRDYLYDHNFIANNTAMYRKATIMRLDGYDESLLSVEDYDVWLKFADEHARFTYVPEPLALYRRHGEQHTGPAGAALIKGNAGLVRAKHARFR